MMPLQSKEQEKLILKVDFDKLIVQVIAEETDKSFCVLCVNKDKCNGKCLVYCG